MVWPFAEAPASRAAAVAGLVAVLVIASIPAIAARAQRVVHPFLVAQPGSVPDQAHLVIEIPAGSAIKYEIGDDGLPHVDRFLSMAMVYPANYGSMPRTLAGDGDPLDALVLTRMPLHPATVIRFRPIGYLRMTDRGESDEKVIGVPADDIDGTYAAIRDIGDLPQMERARIEAFFRVYKALPEGGNTVALDGYADAERARALIRQSMHRFDAREAGKD